MGTRSTLITGPTPGLLLTLHVVRQMCKADAERLVSELMGGLYAPYMLGALKLSTWFKKLFLRQSAISQAVDTLHTIAKVRKLQDCDG